MQKEIESTYVSDILEYRICKVALRRDGILHIDIKADELFNEDDFNDLLNAAFIIGKGEKLLNLVTIGAYTTPDLKAREMSTSKAGSIYKLADAFVIQTLSQKIIANFYIMFHKPVVPTRFFNNSFEAIQWLNQHKKEFSQES